MKDDEIGAMIVGGLLGAGLSAPKPEEKAELQEYRQLKQQWLSRKQKLGEMSVLEKLQAKPKFRAVFVESCNMYIYGFFRGSSIMCSALIEIAGENGLLDEADVHYLHGLRLDRNDLVHDIQREVKEDDNHLILQIASRLLNKILEAPNA